MIINPRDERRDVSFKRDERLAYSKVNREIFQGGPTGFERAHTSAAYLLIFLAKTRFSTLDSRLVKWACLIDKAQARTFLEAEPVRAGTESTRCAQKVCSTTGCVNFVERAPCDSNFRRCHVTNNQRKFQLIDDCQRQQVWIATAKFVDFVLITRDEIRQNR
jgi:hypothetical protein